MIDFVVLWPIDILGHIGPTLGVDKRTIVKI
jgi:hypothetical protein